MPLCADPALGPCSLGPSGFAGRPVSKRLSHRLFPERGRTVSSSPLSWLLEEQVPSLVLSLLHCPRRWRWQSGTVSLSPQMHTEQRDTRTSGGNAHNKARCTPPSPEASADSPRGVGAQHPCSREQRGVRQARAGEPQTEPGGAGKPAPTRGEQLKPGHEGPGRSEGPPRPQHGGAERWDPPVLRPLTSTRKRELWTKLGSHRAEPPAEGSGKLNSRKCKQQDRIEDRRHTTNDHRKRISC